MVQSSSSTPSCSNLFDMKDGETCTATWQTMRNILHPAQGTVGFSSVKRKMKDYETEESAQAKMATGSLPFVLGPNGVPYLVDSHHTTSALEWSGHHKVSVTLEKICDWSTMSITDFHDNMKKSNFMDGTGRDGTGGPNALPTKVDVTTAIPNRIRDLKDDPWRSFGALVRKVKDEDCPPDNKKCLRGYYRGCKDDGSMTPFFEFRWAYFMNDAFRHGCMSKESSYWDDLTECRKFESAYKALMERDVGASIQDQHLKSWKKAAKLLVPLCRGKKAQSYILPEELGRPMGGEKLPGSVQGQETVIEKPDPQCAAPTCPSWWKPDGSSSNCGPFVTKTKTK